MTYTSSENPVILKVPYVQQQNEADCCKAVINMVLGYKKITVSDPALIEAVQAKNKNPAEGVAPNTIEAIYKSLGVSNVTHWTHEQKKPSFEEIVKSINKGSPIHVYIQNGPQGLYGHFLLIIGYGYDTANNHKKYIILHDPQNLHNANKTVYYDIFPNQYYTDGNWGWYETWKFD